MKRRWISYGAYVSNAPRWQLAHTDARVTAVAFDAGYDTHEAFTRAFGARFGTPSSGFRGRQYPRIELAAPCGVHLNPDGHHNPFITRDSGGRQLTVEIAQRPQLRVGTVRHMGPYNQIPTAFQRLGAMVQTIASELRQRGAEMIAIYYDDPDTVQLDQLRSDAAVTIPDDLPWPDGLGSGGCRVPPASCMSAPTNSSGTLGRASWANGCRPAERVADAASYEVYLNDPTTTPKAELRTALYLPLQ